MMFFAKGLVVNLPTADLAAKVNQALQEIPDLQGVGGRSAADPIALLTNADAPVHASEDMPVVRLWSTGREPGRENPFRDPSVRHVISAAPRVDPRHLVTTLRHLMTGRAIGIAELLPRPVVNRGFRLEQAEDRGALQAYLQQLLVGAGIPAKVAEDLYTITDELVANATYDAPVENGQRPFAATSRKERVPFVRPLDVEVAVDHETALVLVRDHFGSLDPEVIIGNLRRCYGAHGKQIDQKAGGAGLGIFMVLTGCSRLVFNLTPRHRTEVIVCRDFRLRPAELRASAPTLNICQLCTPHASATDRANTTGPSERELRRWIRYASPFVGVSTIAGAVVPSAFLDLSEKGAFVRPLGQVDVAPGQSVSVTLFDQTVAVRPAARASSDSSEWKMQPVIADLPATVRWVGASERHGCNGFGVEFDQTCKEAQALVKDLGLRLARDMEGA